MLLRRPFLSIGLNGAYQTRQIGVLSAPRSGPNLLNAGALGADVAFSGWGISVYSELYYRDLRVTDTSAGPSTESLGWLLQAGVLIPHPLLRDHLELAARLQYFNPSDCLTRPSDAMGASCGVRLAASQSQEVYRDFMHTCAITFAVNLYQLAHGFKVQASYTLFHELRGISSDPRPDAGVVDNDLFLLQVTGSF